MHKKDIADLLSRALAEDVGSGDVTTLATIPEHATARATVVAKEPGILAGTGPATQVFEWVDADVRVEWTQEDGAFILDREVLAHVEGPARAILTAERLSLNILQRMSGIATATRQMVDLASPYGTRILDTRKTAPGLRALDKMAVLAGGGVNHRMGLYDMVLIKNNHISVAGSIRQAVEAVIEHLKSTRQQDIEIEIEARTIKEVEEVIAAWKGTGSIHRVLLDNMAVRSGEDSVDTTVLRNALTVLDGRIVTEASGNVTLATVEAIAETGVDYISSGALTHSVRALDISLYADIRV